MEVSSLTSLALTALAECQQVHLTEIPEDTERQLATFLIKILSDLHTTKVQLKSSHEEIQRLKNRGQAGNAK